MTKTKGGRGDTAELESLMREFPEWKEEFPEVSNKVYPERHYKARKAARYAGTERVIQKPSQKRSTTVPVSDYQDTYRSHRTRPRSTKRPPHTPREMNPPPMDFNTFQRTVYTEKDLGVRPKLIVREDETEKLSGRFADASVYRHDFKANKISEIPHLPVIPQSELRNAGKFHDTTTNMEHYKPWVPQPTFGFSELPCFTGSILYPDRETVPESTTRDTFKGKFGPKADLVEKSAATIEIEGAHDHNTTNRLTYGNHPEARPAVIISHKPKLTVSKRGKLSDVTQYRSDNPGYKSMPAPPRPCTPPESTIDLKYNNKTFFNTEQRQSYPGQDVRRHPPPEPFKKEQEMYQPPPTKFEAVSQTEFDYKPQDVSKVYKPPAKGNQDQTRSKALPKFDGTTMNSVHYKKYDVKPRVRYSDPTEVFSYPPMEPFDAKTTNMETYLGAYTAIPDSFKPEDKAVRGDGNQDFNTVHRTAYANPVSQAMTDGAKKKMLLQFLREKKRASVMASRADNPSIKFSNQQALKA